MAAFDFLTNTLWITSLATAIIITLIVLAALLILLYVVSRPRIIPFLNPTFIVNGSVA